MFHSPEIFRVRCTSEEREKFRSSNDDGANIFQKKLNVIIFITFGVKKFDVVADFRLEFPRHATATQVEEQKFVAAIFLVMVLCTLKKSLPGSSWFWFNVPSRAERRRLF